MPAIVFPDTNIALGGGYAVTGETVQQYNNRLASAAARANSEDIDFNKLKDDQLLKTLPYTLMYEETVLASGSTLSSHQLFMMNLELSFGADFATNESVQQSLEIENDSVASVMRVHEIATTELGGNDAINCYWSFNENDDIVYPNYALDPDTCKYGLGRVYAETYQRTQVVMWMTFGVPKYNNIWQFYNNAVNPKLAAALHSGVASSGFTLGRIFGGALIFSFRMATLPLYVLNQIGKIFATYRITKYFELRVTMPMYFRAVNNLSSTVAVNMGIQKNESGDIDTKSAEAVNYQLGNVPKMMQHGLDIYSIMTTRARYIAARNGRQMPIDGEKLLDVYEKNDGDYEKLSQSNPEVASSAGWFTKLTSAITASGTGSSTFIGFKVEKSTDSSESISNSTGQSDLQSELNQRVRDVQKQRFKMMDGDTGTTLGNVFTGAVSAVKDIVTGIASTFNVSGLAGLALGTGYYSIPDVWQDSSFSTSYSFSADCVAHYADRVSIFQNYMPLFMLLAGALPRQTGDNTYIQPFLVRGYCQGRVAIPLGIIDSVSIRRGSDEYGWTEEGFPTRININWTVKDLTPLLFLGLTGDGVFGGTLQDLGNLFEANTSMQEYLSTLGGLGLRERILGWDIFKRRLKVWWNMHFETRLKNPYFWGTQVGNIPALQTAMTFFHPASISNR